MKIDDPFVCYCGLYCGLCNIVAVVPKEAGILLQTLRGDGWENFGRFLYPEFPEFWNVLQKLSELDKTTAGCRGGCGNPECGIRLCAQDREIEVCALCKDYPCDLIKEFAKGYPFVHELNERIRLVGLEQWIIEQKERCAQGISFRELLQ